MEQIYSVSQINRYIKQMFIKDYILNHISIKGEVSNCKYHTSGHIYFTLKDTQGQIACVMFASQRSGLRFMMKEGQSVIVSGAINLYERDGKYQLYAKEIFLDGTGVLYEKFEQLKQELMDEGLFSEIYKKEIPVLARKIGIVTASTGAAIQDMIQISKRRNPYVQLVLYPALVQGEEAAVSIVKGIRVLDKMKLDVIIVGRGGGSIEDLWAFNEEIVARAIFNCNTPIISAVGHETDTTISDFVADLRAPTPSAAAELAVCNIYDFFREIETKKRILDTIIERKIKSKRNELEKYRFQLEYTNPLYQIQQKRQFLIDTEEKFRIFMERKIINNKHRMAIDAEKLNGLSPLNRLAKGYAYVEKETKEALRSVDKIEKNDLLTISVIDGEVKARVEKVIKRKKD